MTKSDDRSVYDGSDYGTLNQNRNATIVGAANLLEAADKAKRLRKRFLSTLDLPEDDPDKVDKRGDFLLDLMRLNANYVNQLASIGKKHGDIANSALEKLYRLMVPPARRDASAELRFEPGALEAKFLVRNDCSPAGAVHFEPRGFVPSMTPPSDTRPRGSWLESLTLNDAILDPRSGYSCAVPFGDPAEFVAKTYGDFLARRLYAVELVVNMGGTRKTIPVSIDFRSAGDVKRPAR